jgi:hypothetical protein
MGKKGTREMNREQYISHLRTVACGLHLDGMQKWADLIVDNIHWAKEKTLTDEEIISIADDYEVAEYRVCEFARAILKKASEK